MDLSQLQNLVKRDSEAYKEEFQSQLKHFQTQLQIFALKPQTDSTSFEQQIHFLSHVR